MLQFTKNILPLFLFSLFLSITKCESSVAIIYNSKAVKDGNFQNTLFRGAFLGLMEEDRENTLDPLFGDIGNTDIKEIITSIHSKNITSIVSLLSSPELQNLIHGIDQIDRIKVFTPRIIDESSDKSQIYSLETNNENRAVALLNRIAKVNSRVLTPILDDESQVELLKLYKRKAINMFPEVEFQFKNPIYLSHSNSKLISKNLRLASLLSRSLSNDQISTNTTANTEGILLLSNKWLPDPRIGFGSEEHYFRWFSHYPIQEVKNGEDVLFGMYTVQYVGSTNWDTLLRKNVVRDISNYSDPSPRVIPTLLAFDAATLAASFAINGKLKEKYVGLSGEIQFDTEGFRTGDSVFLGISALSNTQGSSAILLQNSTWIMEDLLQLQGTDSKIIDYKIATSSLLTKNALLDIATKSEEKGHGTCIAANVEISTHDPFNQLIYKYNFNKENLPNTLLVPNQLGYGLKFYCLTEDDLENRLEIACAPVGNTISSTVHCFKSKLATREKRNTRSYGPVYVNSRDDKYTSFTLSPPVYAAMSPLYASMNSFGGIMTDGPETASTSGATTEEAMETTTPAPPPPPTSKLPDLRGILKNVKPFVGGCIGAATGCSVCVIVLGRLPLGAVPAACTGPCFVTTFANCGALLGRTFAETTVICTELFRQGLLDMDIFLVDAEFGNHIATHTPLMLEVPNQPKSYQKLAAPLVDLMKSSAIITKIVAFFAIPWAKYMMYIMGRSANFNWIGYIVHNLGVTLCTFFGIVSQGTDYLTNFINWNNFIFLVIGLLITLRFLINMKLIIK